MEIEATEKFYVNGKDSPAFLYFPRGHYLSIDHKHTLYMSRVGLIATFGTRKKTLERLKEIIESANFPTRVYQVSKYGKKRGKRILFAENKVQHLQLDAEKVVDGAMVKVFNIDEWKTITLSSVEA